MSSNVKVSMQRQRVDGREVSCEVTLAVSWDGGTLEMPPGKFPSVAAAKLKAVRVVSDAAKGSQDFPLDEALSEIERAAGMVS